MKAWNERWCSHRPEAAIAACHLPGASLTEPEIAAADELHFFGVGCLQLKGDPQVGMNARISRVVDIGAGGTGFVRWLVAYHCLVGCHWRRLVRQWRGSCPKHWRQAASGTPHPISEQQL